MPNYCTFGLIEGPKRGPKGVHLGLKRGSFWAPFGTPFEAISGRRTPCIGQKGVQKASKRGQIGVKLGSFEGSKRAQKVGTPFGAGASRGIMTHFEEINGHFDPF